MTHTRKNKGVCSSHTTVRLAPDGTIENVEVGDGCDGNLKGVCALLKGRSAHDAIPLLEAITCGSKNNSCPRQISLCLREALEKTEQ